MASVSKGMLAKVEAGHAIPSPRWVRSVADALHVDADRLAGPDAGTCWACGGVCWACGGPVERPPGGERPAR